MNFTIVSANLERMNNMKPWTLVESQLDWANYLLQAQEIAQAPWQFLYRSFESRYDIFVNMWSIQDMEKYIEDNKIEF